MIVHLREGQARVYDGLRGEEQVSEIRNSRAANASAGDTSSQVEEGLSAREYLWPQKEI
jgi:hypothetical protein